MAPPEPKQVEENTPVTGEPQPLEEQPEKQAEEQATGEVSAAAAAVDGESQWDGYLADGEFPNLWQLKLKVHW